MASLKPLWLDLDEIARRVRESSVLWVATDYDGTLTPIATRPEMAALDGRTREALRRLKRQHHVCLAVLSGRKLAELKRQLRVPGTYLVGSAGLETLEPGRSREVHVPRRARLARSLRKTFDAWCKRFPGAWLEDKKLAIALHYREVPARFRDAFGQGVRRRVRAQRVGLELIHGKMVFEIMPATGIDKAAALAKWLPENGPPGLFYFGDDTNDEPVHRLVRERGGIAVAVGRTVSRAEYGLDSPEQVVWFLEWLAREWETRRNSRPS
jgi:trehalose-phosphatase